MTAAATRRQSAKPARKVRPRATVAVGFVGGMLSGLPDGDRRAALLAAAGIAAALPDDPAGRVPLERYAALYNGVVEALDDEGFGLFSQPLRRGTFEFLCRACGGAADLGQALDRACRFLRLVLPDLAVGVERERDQARLCIAESASLPSTGADPRRVFAYEWLLRLLHGLSSWLVGRGLVLDRVDFPYPQPPHAADYALIYTAASHFAAADRLTAHFAANLLDLPVRRDEAALTAFLDGAPGKIATLYRRDRDMVLRVRDTLRAALPDLPDLAAVAVRLHLSQRTLHRRLEEEGSSYRAIKDALRRDLALSRLTRSRASVAEIATGLGFTDPSAFYRAFVGWTGVSPQAYRNRLRQA